MLEHRREAEVRTGARTTSRRTEKTNHSAKGAALSCMRKSTGLPSRPQSHPTAKLLRLIKNSCELPNHEMENQKPLISTRTQRSKRSAEARETHEKMAPLQNEINQLNRQFWVSKDQVQANKYDLSASRYRQIEQRKSITKSLR